MESSACEMDNAAVGEHFKEIISSLVLHMLKIPFLDIQVKMSSRMFQMSLEFRKRAEL